MDPNRRRDGRRACGLFAALLALLARRDALDRLRDPAAALAGVGAALAAEWAFLRYQERLLTRWDRTGVNTGSAILFLASGILGRRRPRLLAAGAWGLLTYLSLLAGLVSRRDPTEDGADERVT
ncbi:MAG: hypothetical protein ABEJ05_09530 [Haloglomus sp.]